MAKNFYVYKIENKLNGMKYIGSTTKTPKERWTQHIACATKVHDHHWNYPLMVAFRELGVNNFSFEVIYVCNDKEEMLRKEQYYIDFYNCKHPNGYNQTRQTTTPMYDERVLNNMKEHHRKVLGKKICEVDKDFTIIKTWNSLAECCDDVGISKYMISGQCHGRYSTCHGRIFRYLDENGNFVEPKTTERQVLLGDKISKRLLEKCGRPVVELDDTGAVIGSWNSIKECSAETGIDARRISDACRNKRYKYKGRVFAYNDRKSTFTVYRLIDEDKAKSYYGIISENSKVSSINIFKCICKNKPDDAYTVLIDFLNHSIMPYSVVSLSSGLSLEEARSALAEVLSKITDRSTVYNFDFTDHKDDKDFLQGIEKLKKISFTNNEDFISACAKSVVQFDDKGKEVCRYPSLKEAALRNSFNERSISACCNRRVAAYNGFYWRFADDVIEGEFDNAPRMRRYTSKVNRVDENGNVLETFNSVKAVCAKYGLLSPSVSMVCSGKQKSTKGYIFKYAE